jgi:hypothetical protein
MAMFQRSFSLYLQIPLNEVVVLICSATWLYSSVYVGASSTKEETLQMQAIPVCIIHCCSKSAATVLYPAVYNSRKLLTTAST